MSADHGPPPATSSSTRQWNPLPPLYRDLFTFYMPNFSPTKAKIGRPRYGQENPPAHPLAYTYRDPTIIDRALHGLWLYLEANGYLDKALPDSAISSWAELKADYDSTYERESWLCPVVGALRSLLRKLMQDLHLGHAIVFSTPSRQFSQEGDVDWVVLQDVPSDERRSIMIAELISPESPPRIGGGSAIKLKLTGVLDNYQAEYFSVQHRAFIPSQTPYIKGDAILFKLDLQMCCRIYEKVSSRAPRFGLVYSGHKCVVVENLHPLVPAAPFEPEKHNREPPTTLRRHNCRLVPFLVLLITINAPPGMLTFADPDPALALAGYENYLAVLSAPPLPTSGSPSGGSGSGGGSGRSVSSPDSESLTIVLSPPFSQRPQLLTKVTRSQIEEGMLYACSLHPKCSSVVLSLRTILPSGPLATVHRGTLNHETPVVAKLYDVGSGFEALLLRWTRTSAWRRWSNDEWKDFDLNPEERWAIYEAVEKIHAAGVVHGDLEARNIVRDEDGDFYTSTLVIHRSTISVSPKHLGALNCGLYGMIWIWTTLSYAFPLAVFFNFSDLSNWGNFGLDK
ncbi:hypothetical protein B0H14DRAFT_3870541 [Mycena olivaceomarginata]|nr:hypothetical protein B0H14DRAFT_3870541 [Mycena olivaceomarginata]